MLYCTYEQYQTAGGTLDEAAFDMNRLLFAFGLTVFLD